MALPSVGGGRPLRIAYADPPYPGKAGIYREHPDFDGEVDHAELVARLEADYPDGFALSTSARALPDVLRLFSIEVRIAAWVRGERPTRAHGPLNAWEPVIYRPARSTLEASPGSARRLDALVHHARPRMTDPGRVVGAKPAAFIWWLFTLLGLDPIDELIDLYPGSGGVSRAFERYQASGPGGDDDSPGTEVPGE